MLGVFLLAGIVLPLTYLRRGVLLTQAKIERVIEDTPDQGSLPEEDGGRAPPPEDDSTPVIFKPALVSVPLGGSGKRGRRPVERQSLLG